MGKYKSTFLGKSGHDSALSHSKFALPIYSDPPVNQLPGILDQPGLLRP